MASQDDITIDITPTPRILQMLGEVDLPPKRCFAEFIDNALDEGVDGTPGQTPEDAGGEALRIEIETPTIHEYDDNYENAEVVIWDNGPGMSPEDLEYNLKAGYSGKDPMGNMGLFGVGFNIATARLGSKTTVKTTRAGDDYWAVATIDLRELVAENSYDVDVEFEEKMNSGDHGTKIVIGQLEEFARTLRRKQNLKSGLGRMYTSVLENNNVEIRFNREHIQPRPHCIWSEERSVEVDGEEFPAVIDIDRKVGEGYYCKGCWSWWEERLLRQEEDDNGSVYLCPTCDDGGDIVHREQRVWGWVGIQRFFDQSHYGIDLIRNGRVIEELDKSLFYWENPETGEVEKEYPIDTEHWGGRIVGELHIDFVPVTNVKDGFRKGNDRWQKVREEIRGKAAFRPTYAREHGHEPNRSPLGRLFKGYRTGNEAGKKRLVPGEVLDDGSVKAINAEPSRWAEKFWEGNPEYRDDSKWWEAVERAETAKRSSGNPFADNSSNRDGVNDSTDDGGSGGFNIDPEGSDGGDTLGGQEEAGSDSGDILEGQEEAGSGSEDGQTEQEQEETAEDDETGEESGEPTFETEEEDEISGQYGLDELDEPDIEVTVFRVTSGDLNGEPLRVEYAGMRSRKITYDPEHELYDGFGHSPIDSVLMEVASTLLSLRDDPGGWTQSRIYAALLSKYCHDEQQSTSELAKQATQVLGRIKQAIAVKEFELGEYNVPEDAQEEATRRYLSDEAPSGELEDLFQSTRYLQYASHRELVRYFRNNPGEFFDGEVWNREYYNLPSSELKQEAVDDFIGYLRDAQLLADEGLEFEVEGADPSRQTLVERAAASIRLLDTKTPVHD
ncbi:ATP-binding protein [Haloarcula sebkhae]|nr:ATP-binding protein [Haloarcula sebkhae]